MVKTRTRNEAGVRKGEGHPEEKENGFSPQGPLLTQLPEISYRPLTTSDYHAIPHF